MKTTSKKQKREPQPKTSKKEMVDLLLNIIKEKQADNLDDFRTHQNNSLSLYYNGRRSALRELKKVIIKLNE